MQSLSWVSEESGPWIPSFFSWKEEVHTFIRKHIHTVVFYIVRGEYSKIIFKANNNDIHSVFFIDRRYLICGALGMGSPAPCPSLECETVSSTFLLASHFSLYQNTKISL